MTSSATYRPCPSCASDQISDLVAYAQDAWRIGACAVCQFVFLRNPVPYEALEEEFAWETTYAQTDKERGKKRGPLKRLAHNVRQWNYRRRGDIQTYYMRYLRPGNILDVGCGSIVRFREPFVPYGIELSKYLSNLANEIMEPMGGYCMQAAGAEGIWNFPEDHFESIMMHSFLEHEVAYKTLLDGAYRTLKPGGRAFIRVPNFSALNRRLSGAKWPGFRYPDHVNYFTPATLQSAVEDAGFQFKLVNRHKIWLDDNIQALAIKPAQN